MALCLIVIVSEDPREAVTIERLCDTVDGPLNTEDRAHPSCLRLILSKPKASGASPVALDSHEWTILEPVGYVSPEFVQSVGMNSRKHQLRDSTPPTLASMRIRCQGHEMWNPSQENLLTWILEWYHDHVQLVEK
ncbi:unnamed protein product [Cyprideis torosa]|uniref:Uncharacterized protein n=1 Tax=Cyprideis torosa TaxID=163714 RepID=A0A7R8WDZ7_9CRUS|nr:unnamed protein product [Cyprideis torosa]CAG0888876.1 unnamed protein product [Cyprideis torosa]